jgi:Flp pilus assembly protein TadG
MPRQRSSAAGRRSSESAFVVFWRRALGERGAAAVEFALVLPLLALLVFGMLDFGRALNYWIDQTHLANEAARWAVVDRNPGPDGTLEQSLFNQIITPELKNGGTSSGPTSGTTSLCLTFPGKTLATAVVGDPVKVSVKTSFRFMSLMGLASKTLQGEATMRLEKAPTAANHTAAGGNGHCYP